MQGTCPCTTTVGDRPNSKSPFKRPFEGTFEGTFKGTFKGSFNIPTSKGPLDVTTSNISSSVMTGTPFNVC